MCCYSAVFLGTGMVLKFVDDTNRQFTVADETSSTQTAESVEAAAPPAKKPKLKLSASYIARQPAQSATGSSLQQLNKYLEMEDEDGCLGFWHAKQSILNKLVVPALRALGVPASTSPVERVFSQGGIILRPHRARMSDNLLSKLIFFLKCNKSV